MKIGAQFYTIRDFCKTTEDFALSLKKIADIGYQYVQISGVCEYEPEWLKEELLKNGLKCVLTHTAPDKLADPKKTALDHSVFGCDNVGLGYYPFNLEEKPNAVEEFKNTYLPIATALKENGKYFMYHNHDIYIQVSQRNSPFLLTKSEAYHLKPLHKHTNTEPLSF